MACHPHMACLGDPIVGRPANGQIAHSGGSALGCLWLGAPRGYRGPPSGGLPHGPMVCRWQPPCRAHTFVGPGFRPAGGPFGASISSVRSPSGRAAHPWVAQRTKSVASNMASSSPHWGAAMSGIGSGPCVSHLPCFGHPNRCGARTPGGASQHTLLGRSMLDMMTSSPFTEPTAV